MRSLSEKQLDKRRRFVGWLNAGLFAFITISMLALAVSIKHDLDLGTVVFAIAFSVLQIVAGIGFVLAKRWAALVLWALSIIELLGFPFLTILGVYNLLVISETRDQTGVASRTLGIASIGSVLLLALMLYQQFADHSARSTTPLVAAVAAQGGTREFQRWMNTLPKDPTQMATAIAHVQAHGLLRLDSTAQLDQVRLTADGLARISIQDCASIGRGAATWEQQRAFMAGFDSPSMARLMEIKARAILTELRDSTPVRTASDGEIRDYAMFIYQSLTPADQRRYQTLANSITSISDSDMCWITRLYQSHALQQDPSRSRWVRVVLSQAAKENR